MSIQINDIVVYSHDGRFRAIPLNIGQVNIITGSSKTGKTALIEVVNYCFGSSTCDVPFRSPIRNAVSWFGLRLALPVGQAFIARRCPSISRQSSEECFFAIANEINIPEFSEIVANTNTEGLVNLLSQWTGIRENAYGEPYASTLPHFSASVRHALMLCFQPQDEIIRRQSLFHVADDPQKAKALRDTMPYFLGAVDDDYVAKSAEYRQVNAALRNFERQLFEIKNIQGNGLLKASALLAQARDAGLTVSIAESWDEILLVLKELAETPLAKIDPAVVDGNSGGESIRLREERHYLLGEQQKIKREIASIKDLEEVRNKYSVEVKERKARLMPVTLFKDDQYSNKCPLCNHEIEISKEYDLPSLVELKTELHNVNKQLESVSNTEPHLTKALEELGCQLNDVRERLAVNRAASDALIAMDKIAQYAVESTASRAHILGRISLYIESLPKNYELDVIENKIKELRIRSEELKRVLSNEHIQEVLTSIMVIIGRQMSEWSKELKLEHSKDPVRLDIKKLSIIVDTDDGPMPLYRMGSAENWVSYHLISHLALHQYFVKRKRPVPRFIFIDQPSLVYFPPEKDEDGLLLGGKEEDRVAVTRMFKLIFDVVSTLSPGFQVILTEHADPAEDWYRNAIVQRWRDGQKFIPDDWPYEQNTEHE